MKKTFLTLISVLICIGLAVALFLWLFPLSQLQKETIYIAVVGPMSGPDASLGESMINGATHYLDHMHKNRNELPGKKIELLVYDDKNDEYTAKMIAAQIVNQKKAVLVIGHEDSATSIAAGKVYKRNEICAITASAIEDAVTLENDYYYRLIPSDVSQVNFIANYIRKTLNQTSANIIFNKDKYGIFFSENFERISKRLGIAIKIKCGFDSSEFKTKQMFEKIVNDNDFTTGATFIATGSHEAAQIISILKEKGTSFIIGPDFLSKKAFIDELNKNPKEKKSPGFYSDNIITVSPLITEVADKEAYFFYKSFKNKYNKEPTWMAGCYYDAMHVAVEALKKADVRGKGYILSDRRKIKPALRSFYNYKNAIRGISGSIFFNEHGNVYRPPFIGFYKNQKLYPGFIQYQPISESDQIEYAFKKALEGEFILSEGKIMTQTRIVYTGIYINEIKNIDIIHSCYTADFYLWFRYIGEFDDTQIEFLNATNSIELGPPIKQATGDNNINYRAYHINGGFHGNFDFHRFPFDQHTIQITFRHAKLLKNQLIYVSDSFGLMEIKERLNKTKLIGADEWQQGPISFYQDTIEKRTTLGNPIFFNSNYSLKFSSFTASMPIEKKDLNSILKQYYLPIGIITILILIFMNSVPKKYIGLLLSTFAILLAANTVLHLKFMTDLTIDYISTIEYIYLSNYITIIISSFVILLAYHTKDSRHSKMAHGMIYLGRCINYIIVLSISCLQLYVYAITKGV